MVKKAAQATSNHLLRAAREERGWTQPDHIGAPHSFNISRWESGTASPRAHFVEQLCLLFGATPRELGLLHSDESTGSEPTPSPPGENIFLPLASAMLWNVPFRRNPFFAGREDLLTNLHEHFSRERTAAFTQSYALSGLGGIGKTQTAVEYAYRYRSEYRAVLWVSAASRESLIADYMSLARLLELPDQNAPDQLLVVSSVRQKLAVHKQWLLILDNADDLSLASDFIPAGGEGHILLTSRAQATGMVAASMAVEKMDQDEGMLLLLRRAKLLAPDAVSNTVAPVVRARAQAIVRMMDGLPLALDQAGAYIEETGCGLSEFLELLKRQWTDLLKRRGTMSPEYPNTVFTTWSLNFHQVEQTNRAAADLLRLCAFLDPDAISEEIISEGASKLSEVLGPVAADPFRLNGAIEVLRRFSLVRRNAEEKVLTIHRLVQTVLRESMEEQNRQQWAAYAISAVEAAFPEVTFASWDRCQQLLPHVQTCVQLIDEYQFTFPEATQLLTNAGLYLQVRGGYEQAELLFKRAFSIREQTLGFEHSDTAIILNKLAMLYCLQGKYEQSEPLCQQALLINEQALGLEHPEVAETLNILGILYEKLGRYAQAEPLYKRALVIKERAPGPEDLEAIRSMLNNLALLYWKQGKYKQAEPLY